MHQQLVRMLEKNDTHLLGASHEHLGKALNVFATAMLTASLSDKLSLCTEETKARMKNLIAQMQGGLPAETMQKAFAELDAEKQAALQAAMA